MLFSFLESVCQNLQVCEPQPPQGYGGHIKFKNVPVDAESVLNDVQSALGSDMHRVGGGWRMLHATLQRTGPLHLLSLTRTHPDLRLALAGSRVQSSWRHTVPAAL